MEQQQSKLRKKIILSGMQPTHRLMIGNYVGALRQWVQLQEEYDCLFAIVDLHALTVPQDPAKLRQRTLEVAALYLAAGIDPEKSIIFVQSHVPAHTQLTWVLSCFTYMGECSRMTQFKEKSAKQKNINVGLFTYPILMAADILLYQADLVPVGADQKQHLELTRNLAQRFNHYYPNTFTVPEPYIPPIGAKIMSLQNPQKKMSKSDPEEKATLFLTDPPDVIRSKIRRAVTDSERTIAYDPEKRPGISNLVTLYHVATGKPIETIVAEFEGKGYKEFKEALAEALIEMLRPLQQRFHELMAEKTELKNILRKGAEAAGQRAYRTLRKVYKKVGLLLPDA